MENQNQILRDKILSYLAEGKSPRLIAETLNAEGINRPADGKPITRKDVNNRLMGLRNSGLLPPLKKSKKVKKNKPQIGANMSETTLTIEQVKKATGLTQENIAKEVKVNPSSIVKWKQKGIPEAHMSKFVKLMSGGNVGEVNNSKPKKRKYKKRAAATPILKEVTPEEIGIITNESATMFIVTKDKEVISSLLARFI